MSQLMRLWYLSHRRPAKTQASLRICAVSPEPSPFAHMKHGSRQKVRLKIRHRAHWMAATARLKYEFTEDEKCHNLMSWLKYAWRTTCYRTAHVICQSSKKKKSNKLGHVTRKPVFGVCDQVRHKPACSVAETS